MKDHFYTRLCLLLISISLISNFLCAQCSISFCGDPVINADRPIYNATNNSIEIDNLTFSNIGCAQANKQLGIDIYVYQILPNNSRATLCDVIDVAPDNVTGYARIDLGKSNLCNSTYNLGKISINDVAGLNICDGITYEVVLALYVTDNPSLLANKKTIFSLLNPSAYIINNLGQLDVNINNMFPGNKQPLIISEISDWVNRTKGSITVPCNSDVELYLQSQSLLGNCFPYNDYSVAITSELVNLLTYSINGASPVVIENSGTGAAGGQVTGPNENSGYCYGGILTLGKPYVFKVSNIPNTCNSNVEFRLVTFDLFTNQTKESKFIVSYSNDCTSNLALNNTTLRSGTYNSAQVISSNATLGSNAKVNFIAASEIGLNNNFTVNSNNDFLADIEPCR